MMLVIDMNYRKLTQEQKDEYNAKRRKVRQEEMAAWTPEQWGVYRKKRHEAWVARPKAERVKLNDEWYKRRYAKMTPEQRLAAKEYLRQRRANFTAEQLERERQRGRDNVKRLKMSILNHYSNDTMRCMNPNCEVPGGATNIYALCIDHINGGGYQHTKKLKEEGIRLYAWLKRNNYPIGYQVLCQNCNIIKKVTNKEDYTPRKNKRIIK